MLSLPQILLFLVVAVVVVVLSKTLRGRGGKSGRGASGRASETEALDLSPCPVCGNFVAADARRCERADCPRPV